MAKWVYSVFLLGLLASTCVSAMSQPYSNQEPAAMSGNTSERPHSRGKSFAKLEDYLAHLRELGAMDIPYYELQPDGRYRFITGRGGNRVPPVYLTREELKKKFGFSE